MTHVQTIEKSSQEVQNNHCKKKPNKRQGKMKDSFCFFCLLFEVFEVCQTHFQNICRVFILVWPFHLHHLPPPPPTPPSSSSTYHPSLTSLHLLSPPPPSSTHHHLPPPFLHHYYGLKHDLGPIHYHPFAYLAPLSSSSIPLTSFPPFSCLNGTGDVMSKYGRPKSTLFLSSLIY